ncbi:hypothetical protein [Paraburkholderia bannensis]|uniref:hypothetical protein n=1 Tax=Paraburkholderia bannensis TaxID=765414 RepID=UPI002AB68EB7|nr:hypothetical protein [Paraburkholderia bannensis]
MMPIRALVLTTFIGLLLSGCDGTHLVGGENEAIALQRAKEKCANGYDTIQTRANSDGDWIMKIRCTG